MNSSTDPVPQDSHELLIKMQRRLHFLAWISGVIGILFIVHLVYSHTEINGLRSELARRLRTGDDISKEAKMVAETTQEMVAGLQSKVDALENLQTETQSQQVSLSQMYQELSRSRDDWSLIEIEQILTTANRQLQLTGNIRGALIALENADRTLARSGKPRFGAIRRAIEKDIERLRSVPDVDVSEQVLKLDAIIEKVDSLPLVSDSRPPDCPEKAKQNTLYRYEFSAYPSDWGPATVTAWNSWVDDIRRELQTLVQVQKIANPDALMLSSSQTVYVRENLKFRLLSSRLSLLSRSAYSLKEDIETMIVMLDRYFDASSEQVQTVKVALKEIEASDISVDIPELTESLAAIQGYRQEN